MIEFIQSIQTVPQAIVAAALILAIGFIIAMLIRSL